VIPEWLRWVFLALGCLCVVTIALVVWDCIRTTLRMRRMARASAQDFSSDMVRQRTGADDARGDVACGSGVSVRAEAPTLNWTRADYCARCRRVAFLGESILCPQCDEMRITQRRGDAEKGGAA
jgi:hypothetical protein